MRSKYFRGVGFATIWSISEIGRLKFNGSSSVPESLNVASASSRGRTALLLDVDKVKFYI
jgi:hypothetical protein